MKNYCSYFKGKKITVMGLGLQGRGVGDAEFLAECGAEIIVTDIKTENELAESLRLLRKFKNIKYTLGGHRPEDFRGRDLIVRMSNVPIGSEYIAEAEKSGAKVVQDASLFAELAPVMLIGVTGTRGKSTVTQLIYEIIKTSLIAGRRVFIGGNVRGIATLPLLKDVEEGDIAVLELDSWQLQSFGEAGISPHIAVFTNFMNDHQNYYAKQGGMGRYFEDKAEIARHQKKGDYLIAPQDIIERIGDVQSTVVQTERVPDEWDIQLLGEHNRKNIAYAIAVAKILDIDEKMIRKTVEDFTGVPGRLERAGCTGGVEYYNDTTATTPDGAIAALSALAPETDGGIILIAGGTDKELEYSEFGQAISESVKALVLFQGTATDKLLKYLDDGALPITLVQDMDTAFDTAQSYATAGDVVLLSPGAASFGIFKNEFDRGDQFCAHVKELL